MNKTRKLLTFIFAVICLITVAVFSSSAAEVEKIEVESWSQLRDALMNYNNYNPVEIKLTRDISREFDEPDDFDTGLFAVAGNKTLDLNGRTITAEVTIGEDNHQYIGGNHFPYLFSFYFDNSSLTIKDTSAAGTGKVHYDASLVAAKKYITSPICDIFNVNSRSSLTIDGGTYEVGHVRTDWTTAVYINGKLFTGNLRTQVYGTVFTVGSNADLTINGGKFIARGGQLISDLRNASSYKGNVFKKTSTTNSYITINGGTFYGEGGCDIFDDGSMFLGIKINNGVFLTKGIDNVLFRYGGYDGGNLQKGDMHIMPEMLKPGIENKVIVNGGKNYMYANTAEPKDFYYNRQDTAIFTYYDFIRQTPEIPNDRVTSVLEDIPVGTNRVIAYEEKPLDTYYKALGFDTMCSFIVRDSSNNVVATRGGLGLKQYDLANIKNAGQYTITVTLDLLYDNNVIEKREHTFVVKIYNACTHTYTTISNTATCEEAGVKIERCTACGEEKRTDVEALGHLSLASDWTYNSTHHWYYCRRCYTPLTTQAHSWISSTNRTCSSCRYNDNCEWGNAMDTEHDENYHWWPCDTHSLDDDCPNNHQLERELHTILTIENAGSLEHAPEIEYSCVNGYVCDGCGEYFGATGEHKWVQVPMREGGLKLATCTVNGYVKYKCEYDGKYDCKGNKITCSATKTITIPATGHSFDFDNPSACTATCTEDGYYTYTCTGRACTATTTKSVSALGHLFDSWTVKTPATCKTDGVSEAACIRTGCTHKGTMTISATGHNFSMPETVNEPTCTQKGKAIAKCTAENCNATEETEIDVVSHDFTEKITDAAHLVSAATTSSPAVYKFDCVNCDAISPDLTFTYGEKLSSLGITQKITATQDKTTIKLTWVAVDGATGYRVYTKTSGGWQKLGNVANTNATIKNLSEGTKYSFAVRAYMNIDGVVIWADSFATIDTATKTAKPEKVVATQNTSTIKLAWSTVPGATGYRIFYKSGNAWKVTVSSTAATSHTFKNLKAGAKYTFAIQPYIKNGSNVIWGEYAEFTTATIPATVTVKATSATSGKISLNWNLVNGADGYQIWYKTGTGSYKLYKVVSSSTKSFSFSNLKSGTKYTFAVRAGIKTSGGNIFGAYNASTVTVK